MPDSMGADAPDSTPEEPLSASSADSFSFLSGQTISPVQTPYLPARRRSIVTDPRSAAPVKHRSHKSTVKLNSDVPIARLLSEDFLVNLAGDYRYLKAGYYASQDFEAARSEVHPTCTEIMDAYVVPLFLEKAKRAGITIPSYYISNGYFEPPVIVDTINPFMTRHSIVLKTAAQERISRSLTRNFTYAICCQDLPHDAKVISINAVVGWTAQEKYRDLTQALWNTFRIPVVRVRAIVTAQGDILASGLQPLLYNRLTDRERAYISREVSWHI